MRRVVFEASAFEDFTDWGKRDKKTFAKICNLIREIQRSSFSGLGKPEPLRHDLAGYWSREINEEDRLVYKVTHDAIIIASCKYHY